MQTHIPRLILAGTNSGCGKTTVVCALLQALVNQCKSLRMRQILPLLRDILPLVTTDMSKTQLLRYAAAMLPVLAKPQIKMLTIPVAGGFRYERISGMSVLVPDLEKNRQALMDALS